MNTWLLISLILALGLIVGNIMLLKYSAKMKFEKPKTHADSDDANKHTNNENNSPSEATSGNAVNTNDRQD